MHLLIWAEDSERELRMEIAQSFPTTIMQTVHGSLLQTEFNIAAGKRLPYLVFARQFLPNARAVRAESIRAWASEIFERVAGVLPDEQPWSLHIEPQYGARTAHRMGARAWYSATRHSGAAKNISGPTRLTPTDGGKGTPSDAGRHRCGLIREALVEMLQKKRRRLLRQLRREPVPFTAKDSLVQVLLTAPDGGYISVTPAPTPSEQRHIISPFPKGEVPLASDKGAPSRAFAKLVEAERRLGRAIKSGETCVDLGAAPGSWSYVAVSRGARVIAVDRSPLREDLMRNRQVEFVSGDAFRFQPPRPVDWLLCDVIAEPERTAKLLVEWLRRGWCRNFVLTIKLKGASGMEALTLLKRELPRLTRELYLTRLCANKKEACAFGG